jgi:uncharacterized protein YcfL
MKKIRVPLVAGLAALLAGCTSVNSVERAQPIGTPSVVADQRVQPDGSLRKKISIVQVNEGVVSDNLVKAQVLLANNKKSPVTINYSFEWFDLNGMQVNATSGAWKSLRLMGKETKAVSAIAPKPQAVDFVLKLLEAN